MPNISFCIVTSGSDDALVQRCIDNIRSLNIPTYEIIYCGGMGTPIPNTNIVRHLPFDETVYRRWITRKKNVLVQSAKYEICVVMHDYIVFDNNWYTAFEKFGTRWDICVHQTLMQTGDRSSGWKTYQFPGLPLNCPVPFDVEGLEQFMPIQGNYACIKKSRYLEDPQNEEYVGYVPSDMEWTKRIVPTSHIRCNPACIIIEDKLPNPQDVVSARQANAEALQYEGVFNTLRNCRISNWTPRDAGEAMIKREYL